MRLCDAGNCLSDHPVELLGQRTADVHMDAKRRTACLDLRESERRITEHSGGGEWQCATRLDRNRPLQRPVARHRLTIWKGPEGAGVKTQTDTEERIRPGNAVEDQHVVAGELVRHASLHCDLPTDRAG